MGLNANEIKVGFWGLIVGLLIGSLATGLSYYNHVESSYIMVHKSNVGYFAFKNGKAYKLIELENR